MSFAVGSCVRRKRAYIGDGIWQFDKQIAIVTSCNDSMIELEINGTHIGAWDTIKFETASKVGYTFEAVIPKASFEKPLLSYDEVSLFIRQASLDDLFKIEMDLEAAFDAKSNK